MAGTATARTVINVRSQRMRRDATLGSDGILHFPLRSHGLMRQYSSGYACSPARPLYQTAIIGREPSSGWADHRLFEQADQRRPGRRSWLSYQPWGIPAPPGCSAGTAELPVFVTAEASAAPLAPTATPAPIGATPPRRPSPPVSSPSNDFLKSLGRWSGRLDSNQRPPAPKLPRGSRRIQPELNTRTRFPRKPPASSSGLE